VLTTTAQRLYPSSAMISMPSQDDLGQGLACSALAMDSKLFSGLGPAPLASVTIGSMANAEHAGA